MTVAILVDPLDRKHLLTLGATEKYDSPLHRTQVRPVVTCAISKAYSLFGHMQPPNA
jgi:hypothetical protein